MSFEGYIANSDPILRTRTTSSIRNQETIILQKLNLNSTTTTTSEDGVLEKGGRDINSDLEDLSED